MSGSATPAFVWPCPEAPDAARRRGPCLEALSRGGVRRLTSAGHGHLNPAAAEQDI
jgi:hypothetical protein